MHLTLVKIFAPVPHTLSLTHVLARTFPGDYGERRGRGSREYLANVFSQLTRMLIFFCRSSGSYFYFELCTKCLFTPEKSCLGLGPARPSSSTHLWPGLSHFIFILSPSPAAVYFTALTITSCPGSVVRGAWCLVLVLAPGSTVLGKETSAASDTSRSVPSIPSRPVP